MEARHKDPNIITQIPFNSTNFDILESKRVALNGYIELLGGVFKYATLMVTFLMLC